MNRLLSSYFTLICLICSLGLEAQAVDHIIDFLTVYPNKKAVAKESSLYPAKAIFTPVISYSPETNLSFGVGMKGLFKLRGSGEETRTSNIPMTVQYSIENKYLFFSGFQVFFPQERYILAGNLRVQSYPSLYFGVGQNTPDRNEEEFSYSQLSFEPIFLKNVLAPYFFAGLGYRFNHISHVEARPGGLLDLSDQTGIKGSLSSGIQLAMIYDSRDNLLNPKKGLYIELTHGFYKKPLGSTQNFELSRFDLRYYIKPFKNSTSVLAFQLIAHFSHGDTPFHELGRLGGDEMMRGYFEGRYTERNLLATQIEYRQKISPMWGFTVFAGMGEVAPTVKQFTLQHARPNIGVGLRFLVDSKEDLNLRLDFGLGERTKNYYLKVAEAF